MNFIMVITIYSSFTLIFKCYAKKASLRIVGGQDATPEQYHNIVRIELFINISSNVDLSHICTGSVLTPTWVLTAAHCCDMYKILKARSKNNFELKMIIRYKSAFGFPGINDSFSEVVAAVIHPCYKKADPKLTIYIMNDIALLKTTPIELDRYRKLSAVDYTTIFGQEIVSAGYGVTKDSHSDVFNSTLFLNKTLQVVKVLAIKCTKINTINVVLPSICLSYRCGEISALCSGDSGGPLLHPSGIIAVLSAGSTIGCSRYDKAHGIKLSFAIATPVSPYIQWIRDTIK